MGLFANRIPKLYDFSSYYLKSYLTFHFFVKTSSPDLFTTIIAAEYMTFSFACFIHMYSVSIIALALPLFGPFRTFQNNGQKEVVSIDFCLVNFFKIGYSHGTL